MTTNQPLAALFDLDGVVFDTERQYTVYWQQVGLRYHPTLTDFAQRIKGRTLVEIFQAYFDGQAEAQAEISRGLVDFESRMHYDYVPGVEAFLDELRRHGVPRAVGRVACCITPGRSQKRQSMVSMPSSLTKARSSSALVNMNPPVVL